MTTPAHESVLAEKQLNMLATAEKSSASSSSSHSTSFSKIIGNVDLSNTYPPPSEKRLSLSKTYSCSDAIVSNVTEPCSFITTKQFVEMMSTKTCPSAEPKSLPVIIDCRSQIEFACERIRSAHNINCRAKLLAKKLISKRLEDIEANLAIALTHTDRVIVYDQSTDVRTEEKLRLLPINLVVQAAKRSQKKVFVIQGGYEAVKSQYPYLIECAVESPKDDDDGLQDCVPPTPGGGDKENFTMTEIVPRIFVGNLLDAQNLDRLSANGITHIINSTPDLPCCYETKYRYHRVDVLDLPSQNIRQHFESVCQFIDEALQKKTNKVLVHCSAGISRSPTLVLAYMIKNHRMSLDQAFEKMRRERRIVDPNVSFIIQLRDWENRCLTGTANGGAVAAAAIGGRGETTDDHINHPCINTTRSTASTYCGSTSKTKADAKSRTDAAIIVQ